MHFHSSHDSAYVLQVCAVLKGHLRMLRNEPRHLVRAILPGQPGDLVVAIAAQLETCLFLFAEDMMPGFE